MNEVKRLSLTAALAMLPVAAFGWGANGHRIVGLIGYNHLTPAAASAVHAILDGRNLAQVATWPDDIRSDPAWSHSAPWHYISIDDDESWENLRRSKNGDVLSKLEEAGAMLRDTAADPTARWQALAWIVHLVGDVHQPLHVGRRDDLGGNRVHVHWFEEVSNLHKVWDSEVIEQQQLSFTEYAWFIDHPTPDEIEQWQASGPLEWAKESREMRSRVYEFETLDLGYAYAYQHKPLIEERLLKGGVRLAGLLNAIFADGSD